MKALAYGYPKLGEKREFKDLLESFWKKAITQDQLYEGIKNLEAQRIKAYSNNIDEIPVGEMSFYDFMLDSAVMVGAIPERFNGYKGLETYFEMARGKSAMEMTKYFNTNYHYIVPELESNNFGLLENKPKNCYLNAKQSIKNPKPYLIAPFTFLKLSKIYIKSEKNLNTTGSSKIEDETTLYYFLEPLLEVYKNIAKSLKAEGVSLVSFHDPALVFDLKDYEIEAVKKIYKELSTVADIELITYYDSISAYKDIVGLPVKRIGLDFCSNPENLENVKKYGFPKDKELIAGVINGRQVWRANLEEKLKLMDELSKIAPSLSISNSSPLFHLPINVEIETKMDPDLKKRLSFAKQKLEELKTLKNAFLGDTESLKAKEASKALFGTDFGKNQAVIDRIKALKDSNFQRALPYSERIKLQQSTLNLPIFPTTTIGSFPQTEEVRKTRSAFRSGKISKQEYDAFIKSEIDSLIAYQEEIGLDVLVHGEFERTDMVEFFAEKLKGIATTEHGWIISYGSRGYRPPIIYGDVYRDEPMTLNEILYAQSKTKKPTKGMLTGPVTILNWSFYRSDIPKKEVAYQIALAILDEVKDLEKNGIKIIQIDEPAFREGVPIKQKDWESYFDWAIKAFRLCSNAHPNTQMHTHMCYSEFNDIIDKIYEMDFDVISIEASRSKGEILEAFEKFGKWDRQIGIGVYDIHSPAIPTVEEMETVMKRAMKVLDKSLLRVNPDCGLKTRRCEEVKPALKNMMDMAINLRK
ncbi:MAG: 5-methyltetrahydropteroyltriglutamate--homocysteine S-methyltransferase [Desulfurella sp.]